MLAYNNRKLCAMTGLYTYLHQIEELQKVRKFFNGQTIIGILDCDDIR